MVVVVCMERELIKMTLPVQLRSSRSEMEAFPLTEKPLADR